MVLVRIAETGEDESFPDATARYEDGVLRVIDTEGSVLATFEKSEIRGFSECSDPEPDTGQTED